ncbi:MAG: T9SS type A sorting domain-containing protein, partial [Flavobacteriales bacterium]|nr:T9SS type A sorting domain-containing protein [Flavobacteriales bacterium]
TQLDLSTFARGVYFIKINIDNQIINHRIILQ